MKITLLAVLLIGGVVSSPAQSFEPMSPSIIASQTSQAPGLPKYLVYRHFLGWIDSLDKQASLAGTTDLYKFADPFAKAAGLSNDDLDLLLAEAKAMTADLQSQDQKASAVIIAFRAEAKAAAASGQPLPPVPDEVRDLQRQRTALLVLHFVKLRATLGPVKSANLDGYLAREFVSHLSLERLSPPASPATNSGQPLFSGPLQ